jgi:hypothetical protein
MRCHPDEEMLMMKFCKRPAAPSASAASALLVLLIQHSDAR